MIIILYEQYNIWKNEYHRHSVKRLNSDNLAIEAYAKKKIFNIRKVLWFSLWNWIINLWQTYYKKLLS